MEIKLKKKNIIIGTLIGFTSNFAGTILTIVFLFGEVSISKIIEIFDNSISDNSITKLISLGAIINLIVFFGFLKYNHEDKARGVLLATFISAILTVYINNF